ncbi:peptidoglycan DD-metalloendopeptidase family protein [Candidatus Leptofilum sp.]|uniref:peptidoglycan DD-metalloendopeptidase family protein n=1 Tax=Candidatus Leptofilum sp. TaxID=3241576 RepID=UPI003B5BC7B1
MSDFKFEAWPTEFRQINQYFGQNPQNYAQFGLPGHEGLDLMAPTGSRIFAVAPGTVRVVNTSPTGHNYGIHVRVDHKDGWQTIYAHMQRANVRVGQPVKAGDQLGLADNTGNSFGSHLHLTLKRQNSSYTDNSGTKWPYNIYDPTPFLLPLLGWQRPAGPYTDGYAYTNGIIVVGDLAQVNSGGINLRKNPSIVGQLIDLVPGGTIIIVTGPAKGQYTPVQVANVSLSNPPVPPAPTPGPPPPATEHQVDGWAFTNYITRSGNQAVVGQYGINLRAAPQRTATNIGLVKGGSTVTVTGSSQGEYTPVRARRIDFSGPINIPDDVTQPTPPPAPQPTPDPQPSPPPADAILGWAYTNNLTINGRTVTSGRFGTNLRAAPVRGGSKLGLFVEGATGTLAGQNSGEYTPVYVSRSSLRNIPATLPPVTQPTPLPGDTPAPPPTPQPTADTTPGWAFTAAITVSGNTAVAGQYGINLRNAPRRDAKKVGFVPGNASMIVTGAAQGEYTPVRVDDNILQDKVTGPVVVIDTISPPDNVQNPEPPILGSASIGLHASADPGISQAEIDEFADMRPGMIKVLSFHEPTAVQKLSQAHPRARWVVRAFLDFRSQGGVRTISPGQFLNDTINDVKRTLNMIGSGKDVVIELHNEPNLVPEGLTGAWSDGASFAQWWLEVLRLYKQALPGSKFIYPGLSPGAAVSGIKQDHIQFVEASRAAVEAADGLGIHTYWSNVYPMSRALDVLDDYISRFRYKPIWITEASNNKAGTPVYRKAQQYLDFWREIQKRPTVQGVTYFVASASDPNFKEEVWVGRDIGKRVGRR